VPAPEAGAAAPGAPAAPAQPAPAAATATDPNAPPAADTAAAPTPESGTAPPPASATAPGTAVAPAPAPEAAAAAAAEPADDEGPIWVGAGAAFGVLNLPSLGVGAQLLGHVEPDFLWPLEFGAIFWAENSVSLTDEERDLVLSELFIVPFPTGGTRTHFNAMQVVGALCPLGTELAPGEVRICGGFHAGLISVSSEGLQKPSDTNSPLLGVDLYARFRFPLFGPFGISYSAGLFVPLLHDSFGYTDSLGRFQEQFGTSPVGGRVDAMITFEP
jgi:hypothetical protein